MKKIAFVPLVLAALTLSGCGSKTSGTASGGASGGAAAVEVDVFKGGYGTDFFEAAATEFNKKNPQYSVNIVGSPDIDKQLRPRILGNTPPSLMYPGWKLDQFALADQRQLFSLDDALKTKTEDGTGTWGDSFNPSLLKLGYLDDHQYMMPYFFNVWGWWYNPDVFAKNGWKVPKTYEDLIALCPQITAKGIAPITFQGKYPYYMLQGMFFPWVQDMGGVKLLNDIQNLEPGAWKEEPVLKAARAIMDLKNQGFFQDGAVGLSHTDAQTAFVNGEVAMIPCGTWLYSEMQKSMPPNTKMAFMMPPIVAGAGDPTAVPIDIEPWMVPDKGSNHDGAIAFFKYLTSLDKAKQFVKEKGTLMSIKGSDKIDLPDNLKSAADSFNASKTVWSYQVRYWYPQLETEIENSLTAMLNGQITPEQFCDQCEDQSQKIRSDATVTKRKVQ